MTTFNKIINEIYDENSIYYTMTLNILKERRRYVHELLSLVCMALTKDEQRTIDMYNRNELKYYFCRIVSIQVNSTTSPFYYQTALIVDSKATIQNEHIEYYIGEDKSQITPSKSDIAKEMIKDKITDWFSLTLMRMYFFEDKTYREISEEINIPTSTIYANIRKSINKVKENINI